MGDGLGGPAGSPREGSGLLTSSQWEPGGCAFSEVLLAKLAWWVEGGTGTWSSKLSETSPLIRALVVGIWVFRVNLFHFCRQCLYKMLGEHRPEEARRRERLLPQESLLSLRCFVFLCCCFWALFSACVGGGSRAWVGRRVVCSVRGRPSGSSEVLGSRLDCRSTADRVPGVFLSCPHGLSRPRAGGSFGQRWLV